MNPAEVKKLLGHAIARRAKSTAAARSNDARVDAELAQALRKLRARLEKVPCDALGWGVRARGGLKRARCKNLWDVATRTNEDWLKVKNLGVGTLREIREKLFAYVERGDTALLPEEPKGERKRSRSKDPSDPLNISPREWTRLVQDLKKAGRGRDLMGETAARTGAKWPETRYYEELGKYLKPRLSDILGAASLGTLKIRTIIRCALAVRAEEQGTGGDSPAARAKKLKSIATALKAGAVQEALEAAFSLVVIHDQERQVLTSRYGLDGKPLRYRGDVARVLGRSRALARYVDRRARQKLLRHPDLHKVLKAGFESLEPEFLRRIGDPAQGLIREGRLPELLTRLGGWNGLLVSLWYKDVVDWLNQRATRVDFGWVFGGARPARFERARTELADYLQRCRVPVPIVVATRETGLSGPEIRFACERGAGWVVADFVSARKLSSQERRVLRVHVQTRDAASPLLNCDGLWPLFYPHRSQLDDRASAFYREVGWFPRLMLRCGSEYVLRITPGWEIAHPDLRPLPPPDWRTAGEGELWNRPATKGETIHSLVLRILKKRRLWRVGALVKEFAKAAKGKYAGNSVAVLFASHRAQRFAPGIWGLRGKAPTLADYESVLGAQDCEIYVEARHSGADRTTFPLWQAEMEYFWCRWAEQNVVSEALFQSLLSVITPDEWNCAAPIRKKWKERQRREGQYGFSRPVGVKLENCPVVADEFLMALGSVVGRGGASWVDLNVVRGSPVLSLRVASVLALLIVTGAIKPARHWQQFHRASADATAIYQEYCRLWSEGSMAESARFIEWIRGKARIAQKGRTLGWVEPREAEALIRVLGKRHRGLKDLSIEG